MAAVMHGKVETVARLLRFPGIDVAAANEDGETALMLAVGEHEEEITKALLAKHAPVDAVDGQGRTALMRIVAQAFEEPSRRRSLGAGYAAGPPLPRGDRGGASTLAAARTGLVTLPPMTDEGASPGSPASAAANEASPSAAEPPGGTAAASGGASPATAGAASGNTPTSQQWLQSSLRMISVLLDHSASLTIRDEGGADAIQLAAGAPSVIGLLRERMPPEAETGAETGAEAEAGASTGKSAKRTKLKGGPRAAQADDIKVEVVGGDAKVPPAVGGGCCLVA